VGHPGRPRLMNSTLLAENRSVSACDELRESRKNLPNYPAA
jgi:hypothetical protein